MKLLVNANHPGAVINRNIYGHFSEHLGRCIYEGLYVGDNPDIPNKSGMRNDVVEALRHIKVPVLRWPGGCFADEYHWLDGVGPNRKRMVNTHWGGVTEDNSFGTHEFMELCRQIGCEPYVNGNVGSGTVREMSEWVEYMTLGGISPMADLRTAHGRAEPWALKYFAVGNENWGCGGNMRPEYYADEYRRYATYVRNYGDNKIYKVACGPNGDDYRWTDVVMEHAARHMDALSLHHYTVPGSSWKAKGPAVGFDEETFYQTLHKTFFMDELIQNHTRIMRRHDPNRRVDLIVDEWGTWYDTEPGTNPGFLYQQNTMRDALVAAISLNIFNLHCKDVTMANLAQTVNVLQAVILTEGAKMLLTPTYHVFDLYKVHQDARLVETSVAADTVGGTHAVPRLHASASVDPNGVLHITVANLSATEAQTLEADLCGFKARHVTATTLSGDMNLHNTFDTPNRAHPRPLEASLTPQGLSLTLPPCGVTRITVE